MPRRPRRRAPGATERAQRQVSVPTPANRSTACLAPCAPFRTTAAASSRLAEAGRLQERARRQLDRHAAQPHHRQAPGHDRLGRCPRPAPSSPGRDPARRPRPASRSRSTGARRPAGMQQQIEAGLGQREAGLGRIGLLQRRGQRLGQAASSAAASSGQAIGQSSIGSSRWEPRSRKPSDQPPRRAGEAEPQPAPARRRRRPAARRRGRPAGRDGPARPRSAGACGPCRVPAADAAAGSRRSGRNAGRAAPRARPRPRQASGAACQPCGTALQPHAPALAGQRQRHEHLPGLRSRRCRRRRRRGPSMATSSSRPSAAGGRRTALTAPPAPAAAAAGARPSRGRPRARTGPSGARPSSTSREPATVICATSPPGGRSIVPGRRRGHGGAPARSCRA